MRTQHFRPSEMNINILRLNDNGDRTIGVLSIDKEFKCLTLEDEHRDIKVHGETRIPEGRYRVLLRNEGGMTKRYAKKFDFHRGMLHLQNVDNFEYVYIHIGNTDEHTLGCILVGMGISSNLQGVTRSTEAYKRIYPEIANAIESGEEVFINIISAEF